MEQEMLTLNWTDDRTFDEAAVRAYFTNKGWTLSDDDAVKDDTRFRIVDFGKANRLVKKYLRALDRRLSTVSP